jgi:hypothetical protein
MFFVAGTDALAEITLLGAVSAALVAPAGCAPAEGALAEGALAGGARS